MRTRYPSASENCHVHRRWRAAPSSISRTLLSLTSQPFLGSSGNAPPVLRDDPKETTMSTVHAKNKGLHPVKVYFV